MGIIGSRVGGEQNLGVQNPIMGLRQINAKIRTSGQGQTGVVGRWAASLGGLFPRRRPENWVRGRYDLDTNFSHLAMFLGIHGNRLIYFHVWVGLKGKGLHAAQQDL